HEVVEHATDLRARAVAEPADARGEPLELHPLAREPDPALEVAVVGDGREDGVVGDGDVGGVAAERYPAERPLADAEERPDVLGDEADDVVRLLGARLLGPRADVV